MISSIFSRLTIITFGTLYPAYYSFKTVRAKSVDEYMKWMMYWIVFATFTAVETFTDVFLKWMPFYYELKIFLILWLLPSMGNGSPVIYRKCLHPFLKKHEARVDSTLVQLKNRGQDMIFHYASEAVVYIGRTVMNIVHMNIPNGVMGLMAANQGLNERSGSTRPEMGSTIIIKEEEEAPSTSGAAKVIKHKATRKTTATTVEHVIDDQPTTSSRSRRKGRKESKPELDLDINLNEN